MSSAPVDLFKPDPTLWTIDWVGGSLETTPEFCAHFKKSERPIFDLASLTKVVVTTTLVTEIFAESVKSFEEFLGTRLIEVIPELSQTAFKDLTLGQVWEHRSGLQAHCLLFSDRRQARFVTSNRTDLWRHFLSALQKKKCLRLLRQFILIWDLFCWVAG